jgi:hypothetical protein
MQSFSCSVSLVIFGVVSLFHHPSENKLVPSGGFVSGFLLGKSNGNSSILILLNLSKVSDYIDHC